MSLKPVILDDSAARRLAELSKAEGKALMLRVAVDGGGCSGFQYRLDLVEAAEPGDIRIERPGGNLYFPLASSILISLVLTLLLNIILRLRK